MMDSITNLWMSELKKTSLDTWVDETLGTNLKLPLDADFVSERMAAEFAAQVDTEVATGIRSYSNENNYMETRVRTAVRDLIENPESPMLFRKYIRDYAKTFDWKLPKSDDIYNWHRYKDALAEYCGRHVMVDMLECEHINISVDPSQDLMYKDFKSRPCSQWSGHTGYCWEGTFCDNRNVPNPIPYIHILKRKAIKYKTA